MALELIYTSAEAGITPGARGFCTVAASRELPAPLASTLESLSGYRHLFPPKTPNAHLNPVACSHLTLPFNGKPTHVVSRIADAGLDYTDRTNKIAHHLVMQRGDLIEAGPAAIFGMPNMFVESWNSKPTIFPNAKSIPAVNVAPAVCKNWAQFGGDPGWGGVLAGSVLQRRPVSIVAAVGMNLLPIFQEAIALLPASRRWDATFSTYYSKLPPGVEALWKGVLTGSAEEGYVRALPRVLILDLTRPLGDISRYCSDPSTAALVETARTGKVKTGATAAEESSFGSRTGLSFAQKTTTQGLAFGKTSTRRPATAGEERDILSEALASHKPMQESYRNVGPRTVSQRKTVALPEKKKTSLAPYILGAVMALMFVVIGSGLGVYYFSHRPKVLAALGELQSLLHEITDMDKDEKWAVMKSQDKGQYVDPNVALIFAGIPDPTQPEKLGDYRSYETEITKFFAELEKPITLNAETEENLKSIRQAWEGIKQPLISKEIKEGEIEGEESKVNNMVEKLNKASVTFSKVEKILDDEPLKEWKKQLESFEESKKNYDAAWSNIEKCKNEIEKKCIGYKEDLRKIEERHYIKDPKGEAKRVKTLWFWAIEDDKEIVRTTNEINALIKTNEEFLRELYEQHSNTVGSDSNTVRSRKVKKLEDELGEIEKVFAEAHEFVKKDDEGKSMLDVTRDKWGNEQTELQNGREARVAKIQCESNKGTLLSLLNQAVTVNFPLKPDHKDDDSLLILDADLVKDIMEVCDQYKWDLRITFNNPNPDYNKTILFSDLDKEKDFTYEPKSSDNPEIKSGLFREDKDIQNLNEVLQSIVTLDIVNQDQTIVTLDIVNQDQTKEPNITEIPQPLTRTGQLLEPKQLTEGTVILTKQSEDTPPNFAPYKDLNNKLYDHIYQFTNNKCVVYLENVSKNDKLIDKVLLVDPKYFDQQYKSFAGEHKEKLMEKGEDQITTNDKFKAEISNSCLKPDDTISRKWENDTGEKFQLILYRCVK